MIDRRHLALLLAAAALVAGCGSSDDKSSSGSSGGSSADAGDATSSPDTAAPTDPALKEKPKIKKPSGPPPSQLQVRDIIKGKGPEAVLGSQLSVQYVGVSYSTGKEFDSSWSKGEPFPLQLGAGGVIPGWDQGLVGIRQGGRRELIIPPEMAYGAQGQPPDIKPNETLIFVIDAVSVGG